MVPLADNALFKFPCNDLTITREITSLLLCSHTKHIEHFSLSETCEEQVSKGVLPAGTVMLCSVMLPIMNQIITHSSYHYNA